MERDHEPYIVLVHGGFVDGSGWEGVYKLLKKDGYRVSVVQNPTTSLADDVAATKLIVATTGRGGTERDDQHPRRGRRNRAGTSSQRKTG